MLMLKRAAVVAGLLVLAADCVADVGQLTPRQPVRKQMTELLRVPENATGRLIVKFTDAAKARALASGQVVSASETPLTAANEILDRFGLTARPGFTQTTEALAELEARAVAYSGRAQPDLAGMMYIDGPRKNLLEAARALNDLSLLEWVSFERQASVMQDPPEDCGEGGDCFDLAGTGTPYCDDIPCCNFICQFMDFCCDVEWDSICAALANQYCLTPPANRCTTPFNESCYEVHSTGGCKDEDCCNLVCTIDDFCCLYSWDDICVSLAWDECFVPGPDDPTPDYSAQQGYLRPLTYENQEGGVPEGLGYPAPDALYGYGGEGWNLFNDNYLLLPAEDPYDGLYGLSRELFEVYGVGETDPPNSQEYDDLLYNSRGRGIKVAVIEWAYYEDHEDLSVTTEPGQTLITIQTVTEPNHGTACLGIINAQENDFGMTGIAPEAEAYFFPLTSIEQGPRELAAWASALDMLDPGDVISCSYGPSPTNLACQEATWTLIRLAADLGITACIAAGNSCYDLSEAEDLGDSGGIVVGAGTPGRFHVRLTFSNFYTTGNPGIGGNGNVVHIQAWGASVAAPGYGDLWLPGDVNGDPIMSRSYTGQFGGTSAACPQIAGLAACLQGLAMQFYGIPLMPERIRTAVTFGGFPQQGGNVMGFPDDVPCGPDVDPDSGPNLIGPYPTPAGDFASASSFLLNQGLGGFSDSPRVDEIYLVRGTHLYGNKYSVKGLDGSYYVVEGQYTDRNFVPGGPSGGSGGGGPGNPTPANIPEIAELTYLASGDITDVVVLGHADVPGVTVMTIEAVVAWPGIFTIELCEAYDWNSSRWSFVGVSVLLEGNEEGLDFLLEFPASAPARFVRNSDDRILIRLWTLGFTGFGGIGNTGGQDFYRQRIDLININLDCQFGEILP